MEEQNVYLNKEDKAISLGELLFIAKKNWLVILIVTIGCAIIGAIYGICFKEKSYTATNTAMVMADLDKEGMKGSNEYTAYVYSTYLINTYEEFIKSHHVVDATINKLIYSYDYKDITYEKIVNNLKFNTKENSLIITLSYTAYGNDKEMEAMNVVNTLLETSIEIANFELEDGKIKFTALSDSIVPMDMAFESKVKSGITIIITVCFLLGLVVSFIICLVKYLCDDTFKSKEDFKRLVGIDILATIPEIITEKGNEE